MLLWYLTPLLFLCLRPTTSFSLPVNLHSPLPPSLSLSAFDSGALYFSPPLALSLFPRSQLRTNPPSVSRPTSNSISHSWCVYISHSLPPLPHLTANIAIPFSFLAPRHYLSMPVSSSPQSPSPRCISFSHCLSLFVSADRLVSRRAALWHGEMELVCSCSDGGTLQSG